MSAAVNVCSASGRRSTGVTRVHQRPCCCQHSSQVCLTVSAGCFCGDADYLYLFLNRNRTAGLNVPSDAFSVLFVRKPPLESNEEGVHAGLLQQGAVSRPDAAGIISVLLFIAAQCK